MHSEVRKARLYTYCMINGSCVQIPQEKAPAKNNWGFLLTMTRRKYHNLCTKIRNCRALIQGLLSEQQEPLGFYKVSRLQPIEIHSARETNGIEFHFVAPRHFCLVHQHRHLAAEHVVHR
jgi:hypothetical protein